MQRPPELVWSQPRCIGDVPSKRSGHSLTIVKSGVAYLFGGCDARRPPGPNNELYKLDMSNPEAFYWARVSPPAPATAAAPSLGAATAAGGPGLPPSSSSSSSSVLSGGGGNAKAGMPLGTGAGVGPGGAASSAQGPEARWKHTATAIDDTRILVFGGYKSSSQRLNDVWILDTTKDKWWQPSPAHTEVDAEGNTVYRRRWPNVPCPRGAHAAAVVGKRLYVFGGYGGEGFARQDFNDLYALDLETWEWEDLSRGAGGGMAEQGAQAGGGEAPEPRSGHSMVAVQHRLLVAGGWNALQQFQDVHMYDTRTRAWTVVEAPAGGAVGGPWSGPRWNHAAVAVAAVPTWKVFVFGGHTGEQAAQPEGSSSSSTGGDSGGGLRNDLLVYEAGSQTWVKHAVAGTAPTPRSDSTLAYDAEAGTLLVFGGWGSQWLGDLHVCRVADAVGPPYALEKVTPAIGPLTGGTACTVKGVGFRFSSSSSSSSSSPPSALVRLACSRGYLEVPATVEDDTTLTFTTPASERLGPGPTELRVSIAGKALTASTLSFAFFPVTSAAATVAFGPGLLSGCLAGAQHPASFVIQARDATGGNRSCGMDAFTVAIEEQDQAQALVPHRVVDQGDGTHLVTFTFPRAGRYSIAVHFEGTFQGLAGPIRGSPFLVQAEEPPAAPVAADGEKKEQPPPASPHKQQHRGGGLPVAVSNDLSGPLLIQHVKEGTMELRDFCSKTLAALRASLPRDDMETLIRVKEHLKAVQRRQQELELRIDAGRAALAYFKRKGSRVDRLDAMIAALETAAGLWQEALRQGPLTAAAIAPANKVWAQRVQERVEAYEAELRATLAAFRALPLWRFDAGPAAARDGIREAARRQAEERQRLERDRHLCAVFEFAPEVIAGPDELVAGMDKELTEAARLWEVAEALQAATATARAMAWRDVDPDTLEEETKRQMQAVKALHPCIRWSDAYQKLVEMAKDFANTVPLVRALRFPAMRPRHWAALMDKMAPPPPPPPLAPVEEAVAEEEAAPDAVKEPEATPAEAPEPAAVPIPASPLPPLPTPTQKPSAESGAAAAKVPLPEADEAEERALAGEEPAPATDAASPADPEAAAAAAAAAAAGEKEKKKEEEGAAAAAAAEEEEAEPAAEEMDKPSLPVPEPPPPPPPVVLSPHENPEVRLGELLAVGLLRFAGDIEEACDQAAKEEKMERQLAALGERWAGVEWRMVPYKDSGVPLLKMAEEDFEALEGDQLVAQGMASSRYRAQFESEVSGWQKALGTINEVYVLLQAMQRAWSYLEPLFIGSEEVRKELPEDAFRFAGIDLDVRKALQDAWATRNVRDSCCNVPGLLPHLEAVHARLEVCQKSLTDFLDGRRRQFPRYYFVSEADLLDILSNGSNPERILVHTPKIYLATKTLVLSTTSTSTQQQEEQQEQEQEAGALTLTPSGRPYATKFISDVGVEEVRFEPPVPLEGKVEVYMQTVLDGMKVTLFRALQRSLVRYQQLPRVDWLMHRDPATGRPADPAQVVLLTLAVNYVQEVEEAFERLASGADPRALEAQYERQVTQLSDLIRLTQSAELSREDRQRVMVCITMDAHARDVVEKLCREKAGHAGCFQWQAQLKHKYRRPPPHASFQGRDPTLRGEGGERAEVAICDAVLPYDYEYLGNGGRLVITPLTDRIYVTATQALHLKMGCAPAGPAGTGKTETTKDLANALAKVCYVVNCAPEMDYLGLGNIFKGLASSGAWGCFDEFNRLVPEVLSVCSVQFKAVCDGIKAEAARIMIEGDEIRLDPTCGAYITMNPGYLGRSELPEGLKALFRPMTVMVPDLVLICENMLMAEGFVTAKVLASKFYGLYSLLRELLSKQLHYDWGLRAVKSVLVVAGSFKRADPGLDEGAILMRALRDFNVPKIVREDEVIFHGLLGDLFPATNPPRKTDPALEAAVHDACLDLQLWPDETFKLKVVQLEELLAIRHCVFIMGPPGAGKTQCWKTLAKARKLRNNPTKVVDLNPKAVKTEELYGYISMATREWKDGLLSKTMRELGQIPNEQPKWILLDGDLDANWIESMNSVMDDNRMLTLASNERVPLKAHMRMIFEIRDLKYATPATVSRAGILYISTENGSQWRSLIRSWLQRLQPPATVQASALGAGEEEDEGGHGRGSGSASDKSSGSKGWATPALRQRLEECFDRYCERTLSWLRANAKPVLPVVDVSLVQTLLFMLDACLLPLASVLLDPPAAAAAGTTDSSSSDALETVFVYCAVWAFGSTLTVADDNTDYRRLFSDWWRNEWRRVKFPSRETVFDYWLDPAAVALEPWTKSPQFYSVDFNSRSMAMSQVTVPTPETCSVSYWMESLVRMRRPVMLAGAAGTGKTQLVNGLLGRQDAREVQSSTINFNFYTTAAALFEAMGLPLEKRVGTQYGPPGGARLVYFLDDLNLPQVDPYNTQSAIELLRQHMEYGHVYDMSKLQPKQILDTQVVACLNPTAGSSQVNPRLQRWFATFAVGLPGPTSLLTIYQTFLDGHLRHFDADVRGQASAVIKAAYGLHQQVAALFRKTAANFHYEFNIRHLSQVFQGLLVARPERFTTADKFVQLWLHESERVYGDRLSGQDDLARYQTLAQGQAKKHFPGCNLGRFWAAENPMPLVFCHFADGLQTDGNARAYDQVLAMEKLGATLEEALREHNEANAAMDLVLFEDAMKHVCRVARIVLNEGGHALLVGVGGSGKQSLARLAAHICGYTVRQLAISATYGVADLKEDLKSMSMKAGVREEGVMFLLTDSQVIDERFLVYINDLLASGHVADLFTLEEQEAIVQAVTPKVKAATGAGNPERRVCWDYFLGKVRQHLHVVLAFSPVGDDLRTRARKFPALVNCTVIDWFHPWPKEALYSVGRRFLSQVNFGGGERGEAVRAAIERFLPHSFTAVNQVAGQFRRLERRFVYTTPKSFLELLKLYGVLLARKRAEADSVIARLANGLQKLKETGESVTRIEEELKVKLEEAERKRVVAEGIAETVARERAVVEAETEKARLEKEEVTKIQAEVSTKQRDTEADLAKAEPAVEKAMAALDTLSKKDLAECKTMAKPPQGVDDVFASTMVLLAGVHPNVPVQKNGKVKDASWDACKKALLGNIQEYVDTLKEMKAHVDNGRVPATNWKEIRRYLALEHFNADAIAAKNSAAAGLCAFVINIVGYYDIVITVEPKRQALREANEQLEAANTRLAAVLAQVAELQAKLDSLNRDFAQATAEKQEALESVARGERKLNLAQRLTHALSSENERWALNIEQFAAQKELLVGDVLLAAAFISYAGPFTKPYRDELLHGHLLPFLRKELQAAVGGEGEGLPLSAECDPIAILTSDAEMAEWSSHGLPADRVSTENAAVVINSARWPLLIDPQLQGIRWVRAQEGNGRNLQVLRLGQKALVDKLSAALENGWAVLLENIGEGVDPVLVPVIQRATIRRGKKQYLRLGDAEVEMHPDFRLYLHTKLSNPHYPPEIQAETTLVNFTVTEKGLEDQLLALVVRKERPDLAELGEQLVEQQNGFKIKMKELEDNILYKLATAQGDITEDVELIEGLEETKRVATDLEAKATLARATQQDIRRTSEKYRPVAGRASLLFFLMNDLPKVHTYYTYSLSAFVDVFYRGIDAVSLLAAAATTAGAAAALPSDAAAASSSAEVEGPLLTAGDGGGDGGCLDPSLGGSVGGDDTAATGEEEEEEGDEGGSDGKKKGVLQKRALTDEELAARCIVLVDSITRTVFNYVRRGLFERDKLTVAALLALRVLVSEGRLAAEEVDYLVATKAVADPGNMGPLQEWLPVALWPRIKALEGLKRFHHLGDAMQSESEEWRKWFDHEQPEGTRLPGDHELLLTPFDRLVLLRALRPDRLSTALREWVATVLGNDFVFQTPFDMGATFAETSPARPVFFVLFPGVDPTSWVEALGRSMGVAAAKQGTFVNISMGQGQERLAEAVVERFAKQGGWVMLQNCHLMQSWLPRLERLLEVVNEGGGAHPAFRCFISAEPPPLPAMKNMPESLMQGAIKVANEAPADLRSNMVRAWSYFSQQHVDQSAVPDAFKACLFALCWFHSLVLGRRRFGPQGWSRAYSFNTGDLTICANVLQAYLETAAAARQTPTNEVAVPWEDLRYIFGEIMYGGHITDAWDRRTCNAYLQVLLEPGLFRGMELGPRFRSPAPERTSYDGYLQHILKELPAEAPPQFGLHPNAEIGYLTNAAASLLATIQAVSVSVSAAGPLTAAAAAAAASTAAAASSAGPTGGSALKQIMTDLLERLPGDFNLPAIQERARPLLTGKQGPFVVVALQECARMNTLLGEIRRSLLELDKGLKGQLNMSPAMEELARSLLANEWPGRSPFSQCAWEKLAWPSKKSLLSQFQDMLQRIAQLERWTANDISTPPCLWLPGLFNPTAFLTAVMQVTARQSSLPLDKMTIETHVTTMTSPEQVQEPPADGAFVHGLFLEGARWTTLDEISVTVTVGGVTVGGHLMDSRLKELLAPLPVVYVRAVPVQPSWEPSSVGYLRHEPNTYECPVYLTSMRGPTYVFLSTLRTVEAVSKWVLTGTAVLLQTDD